jgi:hypothetical protein
MFYGFQIGLIFHVKCSNYFHHLGSNIKLIVQFENTAHETHVMHLLFWFVLKVPRLI